MRNVLFYKATAIGVSAISAVALLATQALADVAATPTVASSAHPTQAATVQLPGSDSIAVMVLSDVGSRIDKQGDTFAVVTVDDYVVNGQLVLPKGSPGYGLITNIERSGTGKRNGQLAFTVNKLIAPSGAEISTQINGSTSDALIHYERNGSDTAQVLLWGVFAAAKRGDDLLVKAGETFHVSANAGQIVPVVAAGTPPATLNPALVSLAPQQQLVPQVVPAAAATAAPSPAH